MPDYGFGSQPGAGYGYSYGSGANGSNDKTGSSGFDWKSLIPTGIGALSGLLGQASSSKLSAAEIAERIREYNATLAAQAEQYKSVNAQNQQGLDYTELSGNRNYASSQDDKRRTIADQAALNPDRQALMRMLMQRLGGTGPSGGAAINRVTPAIGGYDPLIGV